MISYVLDSRTAKTTLPKQRPRMSTNGEECPLAFIALAKTIGPRYERCTLENYVVGKDQNQVAAYDSIKWFDRNMMTAQATGSGIVLYGNPGTGKDHLLCALMYSAILHHGLTVKWINGLDLYEQIRHSINGGTPEREIIKQFMEPHILVISDPIPPKGEASRYNADVLYRIIDRRYRKNLPVWASFNASGGEEAENRLAKNIVDRLKDDSLCIHCDWESYRKPKG